MLVLIGATPESKVEPRGSPEKELVPRNSLCEFAGFQVGVRESTQSWRELLVDLKARGLVVAPDLATGDGALGFRVRWMRCRRPLGINAARCTKPSMCWTSCPNTVQPSAKADLREVWAALDRATAEAAIATFTDKYAAKYEKAVACLSQGPGRPGSGSV